MKEFKQSQIDALAIEIFNEFNGQQEDITMQEAQKMAKMELGSKAMTRYEKSDTPKKKRTRKVDNDKKYLLELLISAINKQNCIDSVKNEAEFSFTFNESSYTVKLVKHRAVK